MTTRIIAISTADDFVHVYDTVADALADRDVASGGTTHPLEFFDSAGYRLEPVDDASGKISGLQPTTDPADLDSLRDRLDLATAKLAAHARRHPERSAMLGLTPAEADELIWESHQHSAAGGRLPLEPFGAHANGLLGIGIYGEATPGNFIHYLTARHHR
ncbi:MAG: hypothetical protein ACRCYR_19865 [Phycicoccus sp.]